MNRLNLEPIKLIFIGLLVAGINSCATLPPEAPVTRTTSWEHRETNLNQVNHWKLNGKIGVETTSDSGSAALTWQQSPEAFHVTFMGPMGAHAMTLKGNSHQVQLTTAQGKTFSAPTAEALLSAQTGWRLPLAYLRYWIRGLPVPQLTHQSKFDQSQHLSTLSQAGWMIHYQSYTTVSQVDLPSRITIQSPGFKAKFVIYEWKI